MRYEISITPDNTPVIIRHCSKCNKNMEFYCSEKFRVNSNGARSDIWLIYKCTKCDSTWKLPIAKGIKPSDLPPGKFDRFINNDAALAWEYAFDRGFLKRQNCTVEYANVKYSHSTVENLDFPLQLHVKSVYTFDLKLVKFLAGLLGISAQRVKKLAESGEIKTIPECDILKFKIRGDIEIFIKGEC